VGHVTLLIRNPYIIKAEKGFGMEHLDKVAVLRVVLRQ
jgi:hypothetical protein